MASFQAKIIWKRQKKRENKNYSFVPSLPDAKFKISKKFKKLKKKASMASFKARIGWKMPTKKENKYCRSVSFLPNA